MGGNFLGDIRIGIISVRAENAKTSEQASQWCWPMLAYLAAITLNADARMNRCSSFEPFTVQNAGMLCRGLPTGTDEPPSLAPDRDDPALTSEPLRYDQSRPEARAIEAWRFWLWYGFTPVSHPCPACAASQ